MTLQENKTWKLAQVALITCVMFFCAPVNCFAQSANVTTGLDSIVDFGGHTQEFKGDGDLVPPLCQLQAPNHAEGSFFILWNCEDNTSTSEELTSEVWIRTSSAKPFSKISTHLGFPASVQITKELLEKVNDLNEDPLRTFTDLLPLQYRLVVRDRAGVAAMSSPLMVLAGSQESYHCSLAINTNLVPATESSSGIPALFSVNNELPANLLQSTKGTVVRASNFSFPLCEIPALCKNMSSDFSFSVESDSSESDAVFALNQNGEALFSSSLVSSSTEIGINYSGEAKFEGETLTLRLSCSKE